MFEISDVVHQDPTKDVGAYNERHVIALYANTATGFEIIHGVLDRIMKTLDVARNSDNGYDLELSNDQAMIPNQGVNILYKHQKIGVFGNLYPGVLENFGFPYPCSVLEFNLQPFL